MRFSLWMIALTTLGGLLLMTAVPPVQAQAPRPELKKLHILMAFDTEDQELASSLKIDEDRMRELFARTIPPERYELTVLRGKDVSEKRVLDHYRALKVQPDEGLVFFYGGHGALDSEKGHYFDLTPPKRRLLRSDLRAAMQANKPGLVMILSDCCSNPKKLREPKTTKRSVVTTRDIAPTVRQLLFLQRGTVDVTAATDNASWSDNEQGGLFTRALFELLTDKPENLGPAGTSLTWNDVYPRLRDRTQQVFEGWRKQLTARGERIQAKNQRPAAFFLGEKTTFAVVGIENATTKPIEYTFRWTEIQENPETIKLPPGQKRVHFVVVGETASAMPRCEAQFPGIGQPAALKVKKWSGASDPDFAHGVKYRLRPRN